MSDRDRSGMSREALIGEIEMLRGVGCEEDGDGPCGTCIKCAAAGRHPAYAIPPPPPPKRTAAFVIEDHKDPDAWHELCAELGIPDDKAKRFLRWGEYGSIELTIDEDFNVVGGRVLPRHG